MRTRRALRRIINEQQELVDAQRVYIRQLEEAMATLEWQLVYGNGVT